MDKQIFRINNFDLLRLIAALQVAVIHSVHILEVEPSAIIKNILYFSYMFPGVPIFFFISGFLISKSYESNHRVIEYFQNRVLRLYPGLFVVVTLSFVLIYVSGYMAKTDAGFFDWGLLYVAKTSFVQFYNPDFMRAYGDGVLNGSLWTIAVELQFYIIVPLMYGVFKLRTSKYSNYILMVLFLVFLVINRVFSSIPLDYHNEVAYKLLRVSFLPWFYMFLFGVLVQKNFAFFYKVLANRFLYLFALYVVVGFIALKFNFKLGNNVNPIIFILLALTSFSFAYSVVGLSKKVLKGTDISYGTYIYHMPIINYMLYTGFLAGEFQIFYAVLFTIGLSLASWFMVEKKCLGLKKHALNPLNKL